MADSRREQIRREYEQGASIAELSAKYGIPAPTIRSWRRRDAKKGRPWLKPDASDAQKDASVDAGGVGEAMANLTPKQQRLAQLLPFLRTKREAAIMAGYSPRSAKNAFRRVIKNDDFRRVYDAMQEAQADLMDRLGITREYIIAMLLEIVERSMGKVEVCDAEGRPMSIPIRIPKEGGQLQARTYRFDAKTAMAALSKLAELRGMIAAGKAAGEGGDRRAIPLRDLIADDWSPVDDGHK